MSRNEIGLRFDGLTLRVSCPDRGHLAWLEEFLTPWFDLVPAREGECEVAVVADEEEYGRRLESGPCPDGASAHCFSLDSGSVRLPFWRSRAGERIVFDRRLGAFYEAGDSPRRVEVLVRPQNLSVRFATMRIVRELAQEHARANGRLLLHAAALSWDDRAVLIAGSKGAGKTSLLVASLLEATGRFVSNDRVMIRFDADGAVAHGIPTLVSVRQPTLDAHPDLRRRIERSRYDHLRAMGEPCDDPQPWRAGGRSVDLSPAQLCALLEVRPVARGRLRALLFPRSYSPGGGIRLAVLDRRAALEHVSGARLGSAAHDPAQSFFARVLARPGVASAQRDGTEELAARVPSFEVRTAAVESGGVAVHDLLRGLTG